MNAPCNGCDERTATCHGSCDRYAEFRSGREQVYKARAEYRTAIFDATSSVRRGFIKKVMQEARRKR